jgi:hypothetical protein
MTRGPYFEVALHSWTPASERSFDFAFAGGFLGETRSCSWSCLPKFAVGPAGRTEKAEKAEGFVGIHLHGWEWTGCSPVADSLDEDLLLDSPQQTSALQRMSVDRGEKEF